MAIDGVGVGPFTVSSLSDPNVRAILFNFRWALEADPNKPAVTIHFSFPTTSAVFTEPLPGIVELSADQKEAVRISFDLVSSYTNLTFIEVDPFASATIRVVGYGKGGGPRWAPQDKV